jgi:hypothetical protein
MTRGSDLTDDLRDELTRLVEQTPVPTAVELARTAQIQGRRIRTRRRVAGALVAAACVVVAVPLLGHGDDGTAPGPAEVTTSATPTPSPDHATSMAYRVTERCRRAVCGPLRVAAIDVSGETYRPRYTGSQPLLQGSFDVSMEVGDRTGDALVLAGVTSKGGVRPSFRLYIDGRLADHYPAGRLALLPLTKGRHEVRVEADEYLPAPQAAVVVADLRPSR